MILRKIHRAWNRKSVPRGSGDDPTCDPEILSPDKCSPRERGGSFADVAAPVRSDGSILKYRFSTNEFVVVNKDGTVKTYFLPENGKEYWNEEIRRNK